MSNSKADEERLKLLEEGQQLYRNRIQLQADREEYRKVIEGTRRRTQEARRGLQDATHREQLTRQLRKTADEESISTNTRISRMKCSLERLKEMCEMKVKQAEFLNKLNFPSLKERMSNHRVQMKNAPWLPERREMEQKKSKIEDKRKEINSKLAQVQAEVNTYQEELSGHEKLPFKSFVVQIAEHYRKVQGLLKLFAQELRLNEQYLQKTSNSALDTTFDEEMREEELVNAVTVEPAKCSHVEKADSVVRTEPAARPEVAVPEVKRHHRERSPLPERVICIDEDLVEPAQGDETVRMEDTSLNESVEVSKTLNHSEDNVLNDSNVDVEEMETDQADHASHQNGVTSSAPILMHNDSATATNTMSNSEGNLHNESALDNGRANNMSFMNNPGEDVVEQALHISMSSQNAGNDFFNLVDGSQAEDAFSGFQFGDASADNADGGAFFNFNDTAGGNSPSDGNGFFGF